MPKIVHYAASDPDSVHEAYRHLALILHDDGQPWLHRVTARTQELVIAAAEKVITDEMERFDKSPRNPANQQARVAPRKRRAEPNLLTETLEALVDEIAAPPALAPALPDFEEEF